MVGKTSRCFTLAGLLALTLLSPTASLHAGERAQAQSSPLESLWQMIVSTACDHGIAIAGSCPGPVVESACERGSSIDPNGSCGH